MNATCLSFFNLDSYDIQSAQLFAMIHPDDRKYLTAKVESCLAGDNITDIECRVIRGHNERWLRIKPTMLIQDDGSLLLGQAEDFTAHKNNIDIINNHTQKKNSILNILAHDLAGPIGTIKNLTALVERETTPLQNPKIDRYLTMITEISQSGIKLIQNFMDQEFLESISVRLLKKRLDLVERIRISTAKYFSMQEVLAIQFSHQSNKENIYVEIDEDKFMQVVNNLISNAMKFTPDGGTISINLEEQETDVVLTVADNGIGIPEQFHANLFDKFSNASRLGIRGEQSTGLGMSIIKTIVEWHNGKIWFESKEHHGTTFYVRLPKA